MVAGRGGQDQHDHDGHRDERGQPRERHRDGGEQRDQEGGDGRQALAEPGGYGVDQGTVVAVGEQPRGLDSAALLVGVGSGGGAGLRLSDHASDLMTRPVAV
ncbi:hypothetical protein GCM10020219_044760 [Nonomuraea dietziae]